MYLLFSFYKNTSLVITVYINPMSIYVLMFYFLFLYVIFLSPFIYTYPTTIFSFLFPIIPKWTRYLKVVSC